MYKFCLFCLICFLASCCNTKNGIDKKMIDSVYEINIQNRATTNFGGIEEINITNKKEIAVILKELTSLKGENNLPTKPYDGTILIRFLRKDKDGTWQYINKLTTRIILKPDSDYFIDFSTGQYTSDEFLVRILKYLQIDESKVSALDAYRKKQLEKPAHETKSIDKE